MPVATPCISVKDLSVTYFAGKTNEVKALSQVNLEIFPGEFVIFFGPSGCGKSTLLYSIAGLERHTTGTIIVQGKKVADLGNKELEQFHQRTIGMIFQAFYLISSLSVTKNVQIPQIAVGGSIKDRERRAAELLKHFGVEKQANKLPTELSGGQQQRVAICRSLINDPDILLADEPVGNLDSKSASDVINLLEDLNEKQKKTVILVTHNPEYLVIADRVVYMKDGQVTKVEVQKHAKRHQLVGEGTTFASDAANTDAKSKEQLQKEFPHIGDQPGEALLLYTAREVLFEVMSGFSEEEMDNAARLFADAIAKGGKKKRAFIKRLTADVSTGGFGWERGHAETLVSKLWHIVGAVSHVRRAYGRRTQTNIGDVRHIRSCLVSFYHVILSSHSQKALDHIIRDRMNGELDRVAVVAKLRDAVGRGGVGMHKEQALLVAKLLEIILLGRYTLSRHEKQPSVDRGETAALPAVEAPRRGYWLTRAIIGFAEVFLPAPAKRSVKVRHPKKTRRRTRPKV